MRVSGGRDEQKNSQGQDEAHPVGYYASPTLGKSRVAIALSPNRGHATKKVMTDGIRFILSRTTRPPTPIDVRDELASWGVDMSKYANDPSAIHTTLKRTSPHVWHNGT